MQSLEAIDGLRDHPSDRLFVGDIALDEDRPSAVSFQLGGSLFAFGWIDIGDDDLGPFSKEDGRDALADSHGPACDNRNFVFEFHRSASCAWTIQPRPQSSYQGLRGVERNTGPSAPTATLSSMRIPPNPSM
jgi:hypothetical protein